MLRTCPPLAHTRRPRAHILTASATTIHDKDAGTDSNRFPYCSVIPGNPSTEQTGEFPRGFHETNRETTNTVAKLLNDAGAACGLYHYDYVRDIPGKRNIQCDEVWSFVYAKEKRAPYVDPWDVAGNVWTWTALDADSKLLVSYLLSPDRDTESAVSLLSDLANRLKVTPHITTDELKSYRAAARRVFGRKHNRVLSQTRKGVDTGHSTSYVERHNLTIRMSNRRYARKTNAFSKMFSKHVAMLNLLAVHYNFCRIHMTLRVTPAMEAGLTDTLRDCEWIVGLIDAMTMPPRKSGPAVGSKYRPRKTRRLRPER